MRRLKAPRFVTAALLAAVLAGGALAAVAATSSGGGKATPTVRTGARQSASLISDTQRGSQGQGRPRHAAARRTLTAAAAYLGLSVAQLRAELREGRSLAQIAKSRPGKSEEGLVSTIIKAQQPAQFAKVAKHLSTRVAEQVRRPGGPRIARRVTSLRLDALEYLKLTPAQLRADERAGKSLAEIVKSLPGRSEAGLIEALVSTRKRDLEAAVKAGLLKHGSSAAELRSLQKRIEAYVHRTPRPVTATGGLTPSASS